MNEKQETSQGRSSYSAEDRRSLIREYESSGMSQAAFCREWEINPTTFCGWLRNEKSDVVMPVSFCEVELPVSGTEMRAVTIQFPNQVQAEVPVHSIADVCTLLREVAAC